MTFNCCGFSHDLSIPSRAGLAEFIRKHPVYRQGMKIELVACETGRGTESFAQQLADVLGAVVVAPNRSVTFNGSNEPIILNDLLLWLDFLPFPLPLPDVAGRFREFHPR